jgi:hypothetical protein
MAVSAAAANKESTNKTEAEASVLHVMKATMDNDYYALGRFDAARRATRGRRSTPARALRLGRRGRLGACRRGQWWASVHAIPRTVLLVCWDTKTGANLLQWPVEVDVDRAAPRLHRPQRRQRRPRRRGPAQAPPRHPAGHRRRVRPGKEMHAPWTATRSTSKGITSCRTGGGAGCGARRARPLRPAGARRRQPGRRLRAHWCHDEIRSSRANAI